ncbi:MAG: hypothetical protein JXR63_01240 [Spirochaetales bacterium]|nr:hypothetical protein [Spirochaetales bacterium]
MNQKNYIMHLIGELSSYILEGEPKRMVISLHQEKDGIHLCILDEKEHSDEEIERLNMEMNSKKRPELSGYYGAMVGKDLLGTARLDLLGWQVKHATVSKTSEGIKIDLWIGGDSFDDRNFTIPKEA